MEPIGDIESQFVPDTEVDQREERIDFQAVHPGMFHPPGRKLEEGRVSVLLAAWYDPVVPRTPPPPEAIKQIWI